MNNEITLKVGDAIAEMARLPAACAELVIADPPYNLGKDFGSDSDERSFPDYIAFSKRWLTEAHRILKPTGAIYVMMGFRFISRVFEILETELRMKFINWVCWHYTQGIGKTRGFSPRHDDILFFTKTNDYIFNLDEVRVPQKYYRGRNNMRGANPGDVWTFSHVHYCNQNRQDHPTQKPEGLIERMVLASSNHGDLVVDPFAGSGTTPRVCQQLGRHCVAIEVNPQYVALANARLSSPFTGFDSVDPRMERVPQDLTDPTVREEYLKDHQRWFLKNHENAVAEFECRVNALYRRDRSKADCTQAEFDFS